MTDTSQVQQRTELVKAQTIEVGLTLGGIHIASVADWAKIADLLSRGGLGVPEHCRNEPGVCFTLCIQAGEWGMPIMAVVNKSYVPRGGNRIGYESQLIHAVIEKNAPIKNRLRYEILGEGDERRCKVWATFRGEETPHEYTSQTLKQMHPGHVTKDGKEYVKGSHMWDKDPEVQMFYAASRQWARLFCPDVLLGAYTPEEMESAPPMQDVTPKLEGLAQRLRDAKAAHTTDRGFDHDHVMREAAQRNSIIEGEANPGTAEQEKSDEHVIEPDVQRRQEATGGGDDGNRDQSAGEGIVGAAGDVGREPARDPAENTPAREKGGGQIAGTKRGASRPPSRKR